MIRFILRHNRTIGREVLRDLFTVDAEVPELERHLLRGGFDFAEERFAFVELVGVEVIEAQAAGTAPAPGPRTCAQCHDELGSDPGPRCLDCEMEGYLDDETPG